MFEHPSPNKIILIGDLNIDIFMQMDTYPQPGGDGFARQLIIQIGGSATNTAVVLARLGCEPQLFAQAGDDVWARLALDALRNEGIATDHIMCEAGAATGLIVLPVTPDGERTMLCYRGANNRLNKEVITPSALSGGRAMHLSGYAFLKAPQSEAAWQAVELAAQLSIPLSLDIGVDPAHRMGQRLIDLLPRLNLLVLGEPEARAIAQTASIETALAFLIDQGVGLVALKQGKRGCQLVTPDEQWQIPSFNVPVVDTTGAGDAFSAGLLFGLDQNMSLPAAGLLANGLGALAAMAWGAGPALPTAEQMIAFINQPENQTSHPAPWIAEVVERLNHVLTRRSR